MNYGDLLYLAHENKCNDSNKEVRCYNTKFSPPQKIIKSKVSSDNIKKFLARKEEEEKRRAQEAQRRKNELLALRSQDKKAQKRVQVMLKRTKSANKSVMEDAIDNVNTADTLNGPNQCDDDDYGYVSQEASALYNKLINKYENMPPEPSIFAKGKKEVKDLAAAKDRVKIALQREAEEAEFPHKRKKKSKPEVNDLILESDSDDSSAEPLEEPKMKKMKVMSKYDSECEYSRQELTENVKPKGKKLASAPPFDFNELMKLAKEKQHEPIVIDTSGRPKEPPRLMTGKEKAEFIRQEERKRNRLIKEKSGNSVPTFENKVVQKEPQIKPQQANQIKIPKLSNSTSQDRTMNKKKEKSFDVTTKIDRQHVAQKKVSFDSKSEVSERLKKSGDVWQKPCNMVKREVTEYKKMASDSVKQIMTEKRSKPMTSISQIKKKITANDEYVPKPKVSIKNVDKELSDIDREIELLRKKKMLLALKAQEQASIPTYVPTAIKPQPKPTPDTTAKVKPQKPIMKKKPQVKKRCIESDSEYDSELDDFIDDGNDEEEDYSKMIGEIFGYDKSRYRQVDVEDDECMESNYAQQMKEEYVSTKIGIMEDLEDIRKEQEEKRRMKEKRKFKSVH